ncbi:MAG TPA: hypothetical protein VHP35_03535, partial [Terriglobia bacterium]|nr:hypothetical protein [Terriglobia bacterium]
SRRAIVIESGRSADAELRRRRPLRKGGDDWLRIMTLLHAGQKGSNLIAAPDSQQFKPDFDISSRRGSKPRTVEGPEKAFKRQMVEAKTSCTLG